MSRVRYLVDNSVLSRLSKPEVAERFLELRSAGALGISAPAEFELGFSARNGEDHAAILSLLGALTHVPTSESDLRRAIEIQGELAQTSRHRGVSLVDALTAATAETRDLMVLHYDADFELIAEVTGRPGEWVVARGSID